MGEYDHAIATAQRLIAKKGQTVTWQVRENGVSVDAETPWKPEDAPVVEHQVSIVFLPYNRSNYEFLKMMTGTEVAVGKTYGLMGAVGFDPVLKDTIVRDGESMGVATIDVLAPNGQPVLYTIGFDR